jgi:tetratricopeptide (TPR) repeat protein
VREEPKHAAAWRILADCLRLMGKDKDAAAAYRQVIAFGGRDEGARARLILADLVEPHEAERILREFLKTPQLPALEASARLKRAKALLALSRKDEARAELQHITRKLSQTPSAPEALQLLKAP